MHENAPDDVNDKRYRDNLRKGVYVFPNLITSASLYFGFYGMLVVMEGNFVTSAYCIIISAILDTLDGKVARMTNSVSRFGVEYDSLADVVAFGVAPAFMVYHWALQPYGRVGALASFIFLLCGALRLARFNVQINTVESRRFNGLPIPAGALTLASTVLFFHEVGGEGTTFKEHFVLVQTFTVAFLMISNFSYFSLKGFDLIKRRPFSTLALILLVLVFVVARHELTLFLVFIGYAISGPVGYLLGRRIVHRRQ